MVVYLQVSQKRRKVCQAVKNAVVPFVYLLSVAKLSTWANVNYSVAMVNLQLEDLADFENGLNPGPDLNTRNNPKYIPFRNFGFPCWHANKSICFCQAD